MSLEDNSRRNRRWGISWLLLSGALALHVLDEAVNDYLSFYNPAVESWRGRWPGLPLPTFTFGLWLGLLIGAVVVLLVLSVLVFQGKWGMKPVSHIFGWLMLGNGLMHIFQSIGYGELLAGFWSSPLLMIGAFFLLRSIPRRKEKSRFRRSD